MSILFDDRRAAARLAGRREVAVLWLATVRDVVINVPLVWLDEWRADTPPQQARRQQRSGGIMESLLKDVFHAVRSFLRTPGYTAVLVGTIAIGIGANSAIFSVVQAVLMDPLPYESPDELVIVWSEMRNRNVRHFPHSAPNLRDYRDARSFEELAGYFGFSQSLTGEGIEAELVDVGFVTNNFLPMLGVRPMMGRGFEAADATPFNPFASPGASPPTQAVVLSYGFWQRRFGGDPNVLGRTLQLGGGPAEVVGVMPEGFEWMLPPTAKMPTDVDLWTSARLDYDNAPRANVFLMVIGRLNDGVTVAAAQAEMDGIAARVREQVQIFATAGFALRVEPLQTDLTRHVRPTLVALLGAVGFVLLIGCANVANLLMVRATSRWRELSIRAALGGSRGRLVRQLLIESLVLSVGGGVIGLMLAQAGINLLVALGPADLPRLHAVGLNGTVLAFTIGLVVVAALLFGALPAWQSARTNLTDALRGRSSNAMTRAQTRLRGGMVVFEVALSLVLLIGAGLMVRSFVALTQVDPGFDDENVLTFNVSLPAIKYPQAEQRATFQTTLAERLRSLPGVERVSAATPLPLSGQAVNGRYGTEAALEDDRNFLQADYRMVLAGYFETMGTPILEGRGFTVADNNDSVPNVVVDEVLAGKTWPGESAVGKRLLVRITGTEAEWVNVIGVARHQRHASLAEQGSETVYFTDRYVGSLGSLTWVLKTANDPLGVVNAVRTELAAMDPDIPLADVRTMSSIVKDARKTTQFSLVLIAVFAASALILAAVGLYGVLSYVVKQRTGEIGIRMAFGAETGRILKLVVGQGMTLALIGVGVGVVAAFGLTRVMSSMLVGVTPRDPLTFVGIPLVFVSVAFASCFVPALRAAQVDPLDALREEG